MEFWEATPRMIYSQIEKYYELHCNSSKGESEQKRNSRSEIRGETIRLKAVD